MTTEFFTYSSIFPPSRRDELAELIFFNVQQDRFRADIVSAIELYGVPQIITSGNSLRFLVEKVGMIQSLFALDGDTASDRLAGVMLFARLSEEDMVLLHLAVHPDYAHNGASEHRLLVWRLINQLRLICRTLKGVKRLEVLYGVRSRIVSIKPSGQSTQ